MGLLDKKTAILSGVGEGLGRDAALAFSREGANLVLVARSDAVIGPLSREIEAVGGRSCPVQADIQRLEDCKKVAARTIERFGGIDILVNIAYRSEGNAGAIGRTEFRTFLESDADLGNWRPQFELNVFATMQMTKVVAENMVERGSGRIIMVNTMLSGRAAWHPRQPSYAASKAALESLTRSLAVELGPHGIRVNGLHPGFMWGPQVEQILKTWAEQRGTTVQEEKERVAQETLLRYIPPTSEYVGTLLYLASDLSLPVTGQAIHVNAGQYLH